MFELTINNKIYGFKFGIGFMKELDPKATKKIDGTNKTKNVGMQLAIGGLYDGDINDLIDILEIGNKFSGGERISRKDLEDFIESSCEDIEALFKSVLDFLEANNVTKKIVKNLNELVEKEKANK